MENVGDGLEMLLVFGLAGSGFISYSRSQLIGT